MAGLFEGFALHSKIESYTIFATPNTGGKHGFLPFIRGFNEKMTQCQQNSSNKKALKNQGFKVIFDGGRSRNRTGVHGFAIRCITTLPSSHRNCHVSHDTPTDDTKNPG